MKGIIIASHGPMAQGIVDTSKFFFGEQDQFQACCLDPDDTPASYLEKIKEAISHVDKGEGVIIFCDLRFGIPCDCLCRIMSEEKPPNDIHVLTGVDLAMVLQALNLRSYTDIDPEELVQIGNESIADLNKLIHV